MKPLKLNYKRTALIGFAFFGILLLWQVYDSWCPTFLTDIFARNIYEMSSAELKASDPEKILNVQWIVGIIMACDNLAALILLPIFGNLSDKTKTPIGKPRPAMVELALERTGFTAEQAVIIGDRLYTDVACGVNAGIDSIFVLSGEGVMEDIEKYQITPTWVFQNIEKVWEELR